MKLTGAEEREVERRWEEEKHKKKTEKEKLFVGSINRWSGVDASLSTHT